MRAEGLIAPVAQGGVPPASSDEGQRNLLSNAGGQVAEDALLAEMRALQEKVSGITGTAVASCDGLIVRGDTGGFDPDNLAALAATWLALAQRMSREAGQGHWSAARRPRRVPDGLLTRQPRERPARRPWASADLDRMDRHDDKTSHTPI